MTTLYAALAAGLRVRRLNPDLWVVEQSGAFVGAARSFSGAIAHVEFRLAWAELEREGIVS